MIIGNKIFLAESISARLQRRPLEEKQSRKSERLTNERFCYLRTCGCVQALSVLKEIPSDKCLVCDKPFTEDDVIVINGKYGSCFADNSQ